MRKPTGGGNGGGKGNVGPTIGGVSPDTGISAGDGITNIDDGLVFSGTGDPGKTVYFYVDGEKIGQVSWAGTPNADGSYNWSFTLNHAHLADADVSAEGSYQVQVGYETTSGNGKFTTTTFSQPFTLIIDQSTSGAFQGLTDDTGASANDWLTRDNAPVVSGSAEIGASVTLFIEPVGGTPYQQGTTSAVGGTWSFALAGPDGSALADGSYELAD